MVCAASLRNFGRHLELNVRFGSLADICAAISHVRFAPESGHSARRPLSIAVITFDSVARCMCAIFLRSLQKASSRLTLVYVHQCRRSV